MTDLSVFFAGTAGSVPTARRGLPAILVRRGGDRVLLDCGEGTQRQLLRSAGLADLGAIFLSHLHVDHWLGLLGLLKSYDLRDREKELALYGPPGTEELVRQMRVVIGRLGYPFRVHDMGAGDGVDFDGWSLEAFNVRHRGTALGWLLAEEDRPGRFDADLARELGVTPGPDFGRLQRGEEVAGVRPEQVVGEARRGRRVVYSGDTAPCEMLRDAAQGADVLIHEATFTQADAERAAQVRHSTARQAATLALEADVRLLALCHVSTRYRGREVLDEARATFPRTVLPRDFDAVEVPFPERGEPELVRWDPATPATSAGGERAVRRPEVAEVRGG